MAIRVPAHTVDNQYDPDFVVGDLQFVRDTLPGQIEGDAVRAGDMVSTLHGRACQALLVDQAPACIEQLGASLDCAVAGFACWYHDDPVEVVYQGKTLRTTGTEPSLGGNEAAWLHGMHLALLFDRQDAIDSLVEYDFDLFDRSPGQSDEFWRPLVQLTRSFVTDGTDWDELVDAVETLTGPAHMSVGTPRLGAFYGALVPLMQAIRDDDPIAFNDAVAAALRAHEALWGRGKDKRSPRGLLCLPVAGLAALGVRQDLSYEVESGYVPEWLLMAGRKDA